jgi:hypothetical protein
MMKRRLVAIVFLVGGALGTTIGPAGASQPTRGCPPAFLGPLTFAEIIDAFPPPPDFPDPEGALASFDSNDDGKLCVRALPPGSDINVVDNISNARV